MHEFFLYNINMKYDPNGECYKKRYITYHIYNIMYIYTSVMCIYIYVRTYILKNG